MNCTQCLSPGRTTAGDVWEPAVADSDAYGVIARVVPVVAGGIVVDGSPTIDTTA